MVAAPARLAHSAHARAILGGALQAAAAADVLGAARLAARQLREVAVSHVVAAPFINFLRVRAPAPRRHVSITIDELR